MIQFPVKMSSNIFLNIKWFLYVLNFSMYSTIDDIVQADRIWFK